MERKPLGRTGRTISAIGMGTVTFGREIDEETCYRVMDYALEKGIDFFDTAEIYGGGQSRSDRSEYLGVDDHQREMTLEISSSEKIIGRWMRQHGCRNQITLCTKFRKGAPQAVAKSLHDSLERLDTDHIDIYKMHGPDLRTPIAETLEALNAEVEAGRVGAIGCSNFSAAQLREALDASAAGGHHRFEITQPGYNLTLREGEEELFPLCREEEIAVTPYSPLAAGFLSGKYAPTADRSNFPRGTRFDILPDHADDYFSDLNFRIVDRLRAKSEELGIPMVRLAMAWAMTHPDVTAVLIGTRSSEHIDNAVEAYRMGLDPDLRSEMSAWD